jgi:hypothetical protein
MPDDFGREDAPTVSDSVHSVDRDIVVDSEKSNPVIEAQESVIESVLSENYSPVENSPDSSTPPIFTDYPIIKDDSDDTLS